MLGDILGKGGKAALSASSELALKLERGEQVLEETLEITYKATSENAEALGRYLDDVLDAMKGAGNEKTLYGCLDDCYLNGQNPVSYHIDVPDGGEIPDTLKNIDDDAVRAASNRKLDVAEDGVVDVDRYVNGRGVESGSGSVKNWKGQEVKIPDGHIMSPRDELFCKTNYRSRSVYIISARYVSCWKFSRDEIGSTSQASNTCKGWWCDR